MTPAAKVAVMTYALRIIKAGTNYPRDLASTALRFIDDACAQAVDEAALVRAAEAKAAQRKAAARAVR